MPATKKKPGERVLDLAAGRSLAVRQEAGAEVVEVREPGGEVCLSVELTPGGAVLRLTGARLELAATEEVSIAAPAVRIAAAERAELASSGTLAVESDREMRVHSEDEVRVTGKMIHLN
ncbi:MAG: hypothetical protein AB1916_00385 [Thermodesulfobacteriota bacterium]